MVAALSLLSLDRCVNEVRQAGDGQPTLVSKVWLGGPELVDGDGGPLVEAELAELLV
jgi:hypothetical protein